MQLTLERPDHTYVLRGADGAAALVNDRRLTSSFIVAPDALLEDWPATAVGLLTPDMLQPLLALEPEVIVIGTVICALFPIPGYGTFNSSRY